MRARSQIEQSMKDLVIPSQRDDLKLSIELLLDIRDLLASLLSIEETREMVNEARRAREIAASARYEREVE
jgi:hypothetical protein